MIINRLKFTQMKKIMFSLSAFFFLTVSLVAQSKKQIDQFGNVISDSKFAIYPDSGGNLKIIQPDSSNLPSNQSKLDPETLVIINGDIYVTGLKWINPKIIKSLTVLKDTEAKKTYGELGKKGALLITTK
jgi:hypothetical protein